MKGTRFILGLAIVTALAYFVFSLGFQSPVKPGVRHGTPDPASDLVIGKPIVMRNLTIFPVSASHPKTADGFITLDEALRSGVVEIFEKGAAPDRAIGEAFSEAQNDPVAIPPYPAPDQTTGPGA